MENQQIQELTFRSLKKGYYRCNQTKERTRHPEIYRIHYQKKMENKRMQEARSLVLKEKLLARQATRKITERKTEHVKQNKEHWDMM